MDDKRLNPRTGVIFLLASALAFSCSSRPRPVDAVGKTTPRASTSTGAETTPSSTSSSASPTRTKAGPSNASTFGTDRPRLAAAPRRGSSREFDFLDFPPISEPLVATVAGRRLTKSQVFDSMREVYPREAKAAVAVLISNQVLRSECTRHGIRVDERLVDRWYKAHARDLERRARLEYGEGTTLDRFLTLTFGQTPIEYERIARRRERARLLLSRLIRFHQILEDRVQIRLASLVDAARARRVREMVDEGADFETVARQFSVHPSAEQGGLLHPVWRTALHPSLEEVAFKLSVGEVSQVIAVRDDSGRARYQIIRLIRRFPGRTVSYTDVADEIESGLLEKPLDQSEWLMWQVRVERLVDIELEEL